MTGLEHPLNRRLPALLLATVASCAAPRPSTEPLGWGPVTARMRADQPTPKPRDERPAKRIAENERAPLAAAADAGAPERLAAAAPTRPEPSKDPAPKATDAVAAKARGADFVGEYLGEDVATYRIDGLPDRVERDPKARVTARSSSEHDVDLVLVDSSNGTDICTLKSTTTDAGLTIAPGQKCFEQSGAEASSAATVTRGTATLEKSRLVLDLELDFQMEVAERSVTGKLDYHFDGTRR